MSLDAFSKCLADLILPEINADAAQFPSYRLDSAAVCGCSAYTCMHVHTEWQQPAHVSDRVSNLIHNHVCMLSPNQLPSDSSMACSDGCARKCSRSAKAECTRGSRRNAAVHGGLHITKPELAQCRE